MNQTYRQYRWTVSEPPAPEMVRRLVEDLRVPESIARVLLYRGIDTHDKAQEYFRPTLDHLHDPFLMDDMEKAVARILRARETHERLFVFGDYDVDGTNGASMLYLFFKELGIQADYYTPDRIKEGYGISRQGIDRARQQGVTLFLAIDCGITAVDQVAYANSLGLDVIICDHHEAGDDLPAAHAVLDPIKPGCNYPFKFLCGCGVGFKLIQAVARQLGQEEIVYKYLDFVTLASTADIVPLVGENRVIAKYGLEAINTRPRPGIKALIDAAGIKPGKIHTGQIVFILAPRINAVGRLGDAMRAVRLLTAEDPVEASELAAVMEEENRNRRKLDEDTFLEAQQLADTLYSTDDHVALVLHDEHWHPGVVGIVASRMVEKYYKPSIMMATVDGVAKGSARSISGFDVYQALKRCEEKIIQFGGHRYAAGLTVEIARLDEFREAFNAAVRELMSEELRTPEIRVDVELSLADITPRFRAILSEFAPFGPGNLRPVFLTRNLEVHGTPRVVGRNHLRMKVRQNGSVFDAIAFGMGDRLRDIMGRRDLQLVYTVEENDWSPNGDARPGETTPQLKIKDLR
ncbi:MAG TPA: single-stranded-DNA-specific exonuclease RecJ [Bacteroidota bacterium]